MRTFLILALAALLSTSVATPASADGHIAQGADCVTLPGGVVACGIAEATVCAGTAVGAATGVVTWKLVVQTSPGSTATQTLSGPAFAGAASPHCYTTSCTSAVLYADGYLVAESLTVCW